MKNKIIHGLLGLCLMSLLPGPARGGNSPDASSYPVPVVRGTPIAGAISQTNVTLTNVIAELSKPVSPVFTFTNGANIGFDILAGYEITLSSEMENTTNGAWADAQVNAMIPGNIKALDGKPVSVDGFMIPAQLDNEKVTEFLLSRNPPACCYGGISQIHEWVKVRLKPPGVDWEQSGIVRAYGILRVGAERIDGTLASIYHMDADKVEVISDH